MRQIVVIQCANRKRKEAGSFAKGKILFVAHPDNINSYEYTPDSYFPWSPHTWREWLTKYNHNKRANNPDRLLEAWELYNHAYYEKTKSVIGVENMFILSAGWGLVRADYLLPTYNISFSLNAPKKFRRKKSDIFKDYNHLLYEKDLHTCKIDFFGGKEYLNLFYNLTEGLISNFVVHHATDVEQKSGYTYKKYSRCFTNWHYQALKETILN